MSVSDRSSLESAASRRIPLEDFFRKPERTRVSLSPEGTKVAFLAPFERRLNVHVQSLADGEVRRVTHATERDIAGFLWVNEDRILFGQDQGGDENYRLYSVGADGEGQLDLTPFDDVQCQIVDELEANPNEILFQMNHRDPEHFDVYRLDVTTGEMTMVAENPGNVQSWVTDHDGTLRVATTTDGVNSTLLYRRTEEEEFREVASYDFRESASPLEFSFDDPEELIVASSVGRDRSVICRFDLRTGEEGEVLYEHPRVDVNHILVSRVRRKITGVAYDDDRPGWHFFDEERRRHQEIVDAALPDTVNQFISWTRDETKYVIGSVSDRSRAVYHVFDAASGELTPLFASAPWLSPGDLCPMEPVSFESRDGLTIRGYLTRPLGQSSSKPAPLVLLVHGGPWWRDTWGFQPEVQFLANRGYAVLQVNYRGSTGYGRAFWSASFGQWGLAMQDDLTDGVRWAIDTGVADPERVAIYGGSYGGYAALSGLCKTPDLFRCGVSFVGVSNLFTWIKAFPPYWRPLLEMVYEMVGHPERDEERFRATSPYFNADRIRVPLFVAQGANDPRVRKEESDQIVEALESRGVPVSYLVKENEGHGFMNEENQFEFYHAMEAFLGEHLK
ncbi:MAG: S9 family peptidase [Candidatus Eisenbacteria bacterium]